MITQTIIRNVEFESHDEGRETDMKLRKQDNKYDGTCFFQQPKKIMGNWWNMETEFSKLGFCSCVSEESVCGQKTVHLDLRIKLIKSVLKECF